MARAYTNARFVLATLLALSTFSSQSHADTPALDFSELGSGFNFYQGQYSLGWRFTVNQTVTVTALGFYDDLKNGVATSHPVGIFDQQTCELVVSETVQPSDPLTGFFRYRTITPVSLFAGRDYYIAALTTSPDKYAVGVTSLVLHPSISFWGFAIFGNTQPTATLQCPNGSAGAQNFNGDFGPSFLISEDGGNSGRRPSRVNLFCNRSGPQLETARCSATVGDIGTPPRLLPTGSVDFVASGGFSPGTASCIPTQTDFSPGVSSCEAQFQVPSGFPIGARFPIDAVYSGDDNFDSSATSHALIQAGCVGDTDTPCSGAVSLGFADVPEIVNSVFNLVIGCGGSRKRPRSGVLAAESGNGDAPSICDVKVVMNGDVAKALSALSASEIATLGDLLDGQPGTKDRDILAVRELVHQVNAGSLQWGTISQDPETVRTALAILRENLILPVYRSSQIEFARTKAPVALKLGVRSFEVKTNRQKRVRVKIPRSSAGLLQALKTVGADEVEVAIKLSSRRQGKVPSGVKRKVSVAESVDVGVR